MSDKWTGTVSMFRPRAGALYTLPNGCEFLLVEGEYDSYFLYSPEDEAGVVERPAAKASAAAGG
jgi:hypothetical protein